VAEATEAKQSDQLGRRSSDSRSNSRSDSKRTGQLVGSGATKQSAKARAGTKKKKSYQPAIQRRGSGGSGESDGKDGSERKRTEAKQSDRLSRRSSDKRRTGQPIPIRSDRVRQNKQNSRTNSADADPIADEPDNRYRSGSGQPIPIRSDRGRQNSQPKQEAEQEKEQPTSSSEERKRRKQRKQRKRTEAKQSDRLSRRSSNGVPTKFQ